MDRAKSDGAGTKLHLLATWKKTARGRAALLALLIVALVPLSLMMLLAPSWGATARHSRPLSGQPAPSRHVLVVGTTNDDNMFGDGFCSLRKAIEASNSPCTSKFCVTLNDCGEGTGFDEVEFSVSGTITISGSALPAIQNDLIIDGTGQTIVVDGAESFQVFGVDSGATLALNELTVQDGSTSFDGGGIANLGTLTVTNSTFSLNTAKDNGGGIENSGTMTMTNSTFSGNSADAGGGIDNQDTLTVTNCTFSDNTSTDEGGGIFDSGTMTIVNSTFSGNKATIGGGGITASGSVTFKNTLVANSTGGNCILNGTNTSDGHNLSDDTSCDGAFTGTGDKNDEDAGLDPNGLQDNGGPTFTIALLPTSPAVFAVPTSPNNYCTEIDGMTPITTDQRGDPRPATGQTACDIGAYELQSGLAATPTATATATTTATATATPTATATTTATTSTSATASATSTRTTSPTATITPTSTATATATSTRTATATATSSASASGTPSSTPTPVSGALKVSPKELKFKATVGDSDTKTLTITNAGKTSKKNNPLSILIDEENVTPSPFTVVTQCQDDDLMPRGKGVSKSETSCQVAVQFTPPQAMSYSGTLTIYDNLEPSQMQTVQMTGVGKAN